MKNLLRILLLVSVSVGVLWAMAHYGLLDTSALLSAFEHGKRWIVIVVGIQVLLALLLLARYTYLVNLFGINVRFQQVTAATFVSSAVGQWAPGSLAVIELLRVGLMLGANRHATAVADASAESEATTPAAGPLTVASKEEGSLHARLAVASLFDRLVGFFTMLSVGALMCGALLASHFFASAEGATGGSGAESLTLAQRLSLLVLTAFSGGGALGIGLLPFVAKLKVTEKIFVKSLEFLQTKAAAHSAPEGAASATPTFAPPRLVSVALKLAHQLNAIRLVVVYGSRNVTKLLVPVLVSLGCLFASTLTLYFSGLAIGQTIALSAIVAAFPVMAISTLFPIGFAGMGGQQLVAVAVFGIFQMSPAAVSAASLLQNATLLLVQTFLGLLFAHLSAAQIRAILQARKKPTL